MNLVTGATGIVGSHVVFTLLQKGEGVVATRQKNSDVQKVERLFSYYTPQFQELFNRIRWIEMDVRDIFSIENALEGITHVYHCAGFVSFKSRDRKQLKEVNEIGTHNMVNACLGKPGVSLCHVSSVATINNLDHKSMLDESIFWKTSGNESDYALSKYNAEREVWRGMEEGLNAVIVNPGVILGPGFWSQSSGRLFEAGLKGHRFYTDGRAAYVSAVDVAEVMQRLVSEKHFGERYILIENNYQFKDVFSWINAGFGHKGPRIIVGRALLNAARWLEICWKLFSRRERKLSKALINAAFSNQEFSNRKIRETLGMNFRPTQEMIKETCKILLLERGKGTKS